MFRFILVLFLLVILFTCDVAQGFSTSSRIQRKTFSFYLNKLSPQYHHCKRNFILRKSPTTLFSTSSSFSEDANKNNGQDNSMNNEKSDTNVNNVSADDALMQLLVDCPNEQLDNFAVTHYKILSLTEFYMRFADYILKSIPKKEDQDKAADKATYVWNEIQKVAKMAEDKMELSKELVTKVVSSAADANGDFLVPLSKENMDNLKSTIQENLEGCDEAFLTTLNSWMTKTREEVEKIEEQRALMIEQGAKPEKELDNNMSGMVEILAKVFQTYAGQHLLKSDMEKFRKTSAHPLLLQLLDSDADEWNNIIFQNLKSEPICAPDDLVDEIAALIEGVVLGQPEGSMTQRVQAEYLRELLNRVSPYQQENQGGL